MGLGVYRGCILQSLQKERVHTNKAAKECTSIEAGIVY